MVKVCMYVSLRERVEPSGQVTSNVPTMNMTSPFFFFFSLSLCFFMERKKEKEKEGEN